MGIFDLLFGRSKKTPAPPKPYSPAGAQRKAPSLTDEELDRILYVAELAEAEGWREMYNEYFRLSEIISKSRNIYDKLAACEASFDILPQVVRAMLLEYGELPPTILCRDKAPKLYMRLGQWDNALLAITKCIEAGVYSDNGESALEHLLRYEYAALGAIEFLRDNAGYPQRKIYKALPHVDSDCLKEFVRSSLLIRKEPYGNTNKLYLKRTQ